MIKTTKELIQYWKDKALSMNNEAEDLYRRSSELRMRAMELRGCIDSLLELEETSKKDIPSTMVLD